MKTNIDRVVTTHAGSLPRPEDLTQMMFGVLDGTPVDSATLAQRVSEAMREVVARQLEIGLDVISDGEVGKVGFSNYVIQRLSGFEGKANFMAADLADAPD